MNGWMIWGFTSFLTVFQSCEDNGRANMTGRALCNERCLGSETISPPTGLQWSLYICYSVHWAFGSVFDCQ